MNKLLRTVRGWTRPLSQWSPIGLPATGEPGALVQVTLLEDDRERDVTADHAIVSLDPLLVTIGTAVDERARLTFTDRASGDVLGWLELQAALSSHAESGPHAGSRVFAVRDGGHRCLDWRTRAWQKLRRPLPQRGTGFHMGEAALGHLAILYLLPRPVVLVSVDDGEASNLFPMDLIGPVGDLFSLALRLTSPSVPTIRRSRRLALGDVAASERALAYRLGEHHRVSRIDWSQLPEMVRSPQFGLRLPVGSLRMRECTVEAAVDIGSHAWFLCRVVSETAMAAGARLCHTSGIHSHYRARRAKVPWAPAGDAA
jgi:flavin reductase (DIM6/NTAB) family NADH-FMN oxidoreductase RutF